MTPNKAANTEITERALKPFFIRLAPADIALFKFLLESYEGLGILRTLNRTAAEVVILAPEDSEKTILELLSSIKNEVALQILPAPESVNEDWLLADSVEGE